MKRRSGQRANGRVYVAPVLEFWGNGAQMTFGSPSGGWELGPGPDYDPKPCKYLGTS